MKTLFLLGAHGAIGSAIKERFEKEGYIVTAPNSAELDLSDTAKINAYFAKNPAKFDAFIHCAGRNNPALIENQTEQEVLATFNVNTLSMFTVAKHLLPYFKEVKNGHILAISSLYGTVSRKGRSAYSMSKFALNGLIKTMSLEFAQYGVKTNALAPGFVDTAMTSKNNSPETIKGFVEKIPLGRMATVQDIANAAYFLCGKDNTYINGQTIIADGGILAGGFESK